MKFFTSLLLFFTFFCVSATEIPNKQSQPNNTSNNNYKLSEKKARAKLEKEMASKFGTIKKYSPELIWPFRTQEQVDKIRLANNELREIRNITEENIKSENNYKIIPLRKAYVKYVIQKVKKPVKKVIVEWRELEKQVPVTDFKDVERKRYDKQKLRQNIYVNTIEFICKRSYDYAFEKTKNKAIADAVQKIMARDLSAQIGIKDVCLEQFLGKNRETKIDQIIEQLSKK